MWVGVGVGGRRKGRKGGGDKRRRCGQVAVCSQTSMTVPHRLASGRWREGGREEGERRERGGREEGERRERGGREEGERRERGGREEGERRERGGREEGERRERGGREEGETT